MKKLMIIVLILTGATLQAQKSNNEKARARQLDKLMKTTQQEINKAKKQLEINIPEIKQLRALQEQQIVSVTKTAKIIALKSTIAQKYLLPGNASLVKTIQNLTKKRDKFT